jgi:glutaredoxin
MPDAMNLDPGALPRPDALTVYGRDTCEDTQRSRALLDARAVPYRYVNLDLDEAALSLLHVAGYRATPVIHGPTGPVLMEPSDEELIAFLGATS